MNDEIRIEIGNIFKYLRSERKLTIAEVSNGICSSRTYQEIEKGKIKNVNYYEEIIQYFGYEYFPIEDLKNWLEDFADSLYKACDYMNEQAIKELNIQYKAYFRGKENGIVYSQYNEVFKHLFRYYQDDEYLNGEEIKKDLKLIQIIKEDKLRILLIEVMDISNWDHAGDYDLMEEMKSWIEQYPNNLIMQYHIHLYEKLMLNMQCGLETLKKIELNLDKNNYYRKSKVMMARFNIIKNIDKKMAEITIKELTKQMELKCIPYRLKSKINYNIASFYYNIQLNYEQALSYYSISYKMNNKTQNALLFMCACCRELNLKLPDELEKCEINKKNPNSVYLEYYKRLKKDIDCRELEDFILHNVMGVLKKELYHNPYWKIFENEMIRLSKITRDYSLLYVFRKNMIKNRIQY